MNVNGTGAKNIKKHYNYDDPVNLTNAAEIQANNTYLFAYNGTYWVCMSMDYNTNTTPYGIRVYQQDSGYNGDYPFLVSRTAASATIGDGVTNGTYTNNIYGVIWEDRTKTPTLNPSTGVVKLHTLQLTNKMSADDLPTATTAALGVVKVGSNISVSSGTISVPVATTAALGVMKVGTGLSVSSGTVSQTAHTFTIGNTSRNYNGSANVSWSLAEIGAAAASHTHAYAAASHTHSYLPLSGGTMTGVLTLKGEQYNGNYALDVNNSNIVNINGIYTKDAANDFSEGYLFYRSSTTWDAMAANNGIFYFGSNVASTAALTGNATLAVGAIDIQRATGQITRTGYSKSWYNGREAAILRATSISGYSPFLSIKTTNGTWELGAQDVDSNANKLFFTYILDSKYNANTNEIEAQATLYPDGAWSQAKAVRDSGDNRILTFKYSASAIGYNDFTWLAAWNGNELRATNKNIFDSVYLKLAGGTVTGQIFMSNSNNMDLGIIVEKTGTSYNHKGGFIVGGTTGRIGIYDYGYSKWLIRSDPDGKVYLGDISGYDIRTIGYNFSALLPNTDLQSSNNGNSANAYNGLYVCDGAGRGAGRVIVQPHSNGTTIMHLEARSFNGTTDNGYKGMRINLLKNNTGRIDAYLPLYGAVWNDYAECRSAEEIDPGYVVTETATGRMTKATERLMPACKIISDTFGFCIGETEKSKTPIAVTGRVLAYPYRDRSEYHLGDAVCSAPNGTIDIMTREEIMMYPERIIGTVSEIPSYDIWQAGTQDGANDIKVNGRIWVYVR